MSRYPRLANFSISLGRVPVAPCRRPTSIPAHRGQHPNGPPSSPHDAQNQLVEFRTTADMSCGQPLPPYYEGARWRIVWRANGRTTWCRPLLKSSPVVVWRTASEDQSRAP